jgi:amidase
MGDLSNGEARISVLEQPAITDAWVERFVIEPTAHGALDGTCFAAKDAFDIAGRPTGFGNPAWRAAHLAPRSTAASVERLLRAGAKLVGKTCMDEIAYAIEGRNFHTGAPLNPAAADRLTGGSSSGAASAVAAGEIDFGLASDTAGSIRVPAAWCGLVGLRPTHGRVSALGLTPLAPSFDTVGWLTRSIPIARVIGSVLLEARAATPLQVSLVRDPAIDRLAPQLDSDLLQTAYERCAAHRLPCTEVSLEIDLQHATRTLRVLQGHEVWSTHGAWIETERPPFGPAVAERLAAARSLSRAEVHAAEQARVALNARLDAQLPAGQILCFPTVPGPAARRCASTEELQALRAQVMPLTALASLSGRPQLTLPWLKTDGAPVGFSLLGWRNGDETLLQIAEMISA